MSGPHEKSCYHSVLAIFFLIFFSDFSQFSPVFVGASEDESAKVMCDIYFGIDESFWVREQGNMTKVFIVFYNCTDHLIEYLT